jgi:molybdopterin molybdotransferase
MPELFTVLPPADALQVLLDHLSGQVCAETIPTADALDRVLAESLFASSPLPAFPRSTMDEIGRASCRERV